jgi:putative peptidoglycan lipid II flippase
MTAPPENSSKPHSAAASLRTAAALMVIATLGSRITGFARTIVITHIFGDTGEVNAFFQAFAIPDFVYFLIAGGALRTGFVPIFTEYLTKGQVAKAWRTFSVTFWTLLSVGTVIVGLAMLFSRELTGLVAPGWVQAHPELLGTCTQIMRILLPAQIFFVVGGLMQGALNAKKHFLWPGVAPIVYNLMIISGALIAPHIAVFENARRVAVGLEPISGIMYVAYFGVAGALVANCLLQIPALVRVGAVLERRWDLNDEGMRRVLKLALPVIFGLAIGEINWMIVRMLCTVANPEHGPVVLEAANRLWKLPSGIFAAGVAIAIFPSLSEHYTRGDEKSFVRDFSFGMRNSLYLMIPTSLIMGAMRIPMARLVYGHGQFTADATREVADVLLWLVPSMIAMGISYIAARALYARQRMYKPMTAGIISIILCRVSAIWLMAWYKLPGLAMANTIGDVANALILCYILKQLVGRLDGKRILMAQAKALPANVFLVAVGLILPGLIEQHLGTEGLVNKAAAVMIPLGVAFGGFAVLSAVFKVEEFHSALQMVLRKRRRPEEPSPEEADE